MDLSNTAFDLLFKIRCWKIADETAKFREKHGFIGAKFDRFHADVLLEAVKIRAAKIIAGAY